MQMADEYRASDAGYAGGHVAERHVWGKVDTVVRAVGVTVHAVVPVRRGEVELVHGLPPVGQLVVVEVAGDRTSVRQGRELDIAHHGGRVDPLVDPVAGVGLHEVLDLPVEPHRLQARAVGRHDRRIV